jgi:hypothetical protein
MGKMMNEKDWAKLLGYEPGAAQKALILSWVRDEGLSIEEACARQALPPLILPNEEPDPEKYDNPFRPALRIVRRENN